MDHYELIKRGLDLHESRDYQKALACFVRAYDACPSCPVVTYNLANTFHMLGRDAASEILLLRLVAANDDLLTAGCPDDFGTVRSLKLDAYFLLFHVTLALTGSWSKAHRYARMHLRRRQRGVRSLWPKRKVLAEIEQLRTKYKAARRADKVRTRAHHIEEVL